MMAIASLFQKLIESKKKLHMYNEGDCMISQIEVWRKSSVPPNNQMLVTPVANDIWGWMEPKFS